MINGNDNASFKISVIRKIVFNYSNSTATHPAESKYMPNVDSDVKTHLAYTDYPDAHPFEDLTQLVALVQTLEKEASLNSVYPFAFLGDW